jgi:hypothetical protein
LSGERAAMSLSCPHPDVWRLAPPARRASFRRFVRQGVPTHSRAQLWRLWTGADEAAAASPWLYGMLVEQGENALRREDLALIRVDLPRTPVPAGMSAESLQRLLFAFVARRDLDVGGYTQVRGDALPAPRCPTATAGRCPSLTATLDCHSVLRG